jgi:ABC-2 type transport system ATP-binding protein
MAENIIIEVKQLRKVYPAVAAVDGISFDVFAGEIFGIVGPNGAGKTTLIECIEGLREPDSGFIRVKGKDPVKNGYDLKPIIGIQLQESALQDRIKVWEAVDLYASFYAHSIDQKVMLEQLGLAEHRDRPFARLSGGQKQRLFIALALINDPEIVFLDELTTGLDPQARHATWDLVREIRSRGKTIFLTTHFMEEAERLCDRVAIIDHGRIAALDTPENLIKSIDADNRITFTMKMKENFLPGSLSGIKGVNSVETRNERCVVYGRGDELIKELVSFLTETGVGFSDLNVQKPNLEDVFLSLTGREMRD